MNGSIVASIVCDDQRPEPRRLGWPGAPPPPDPHCPESHRRRLSHDFWVSRRLEGAAKPGASARRWAPPPLLEGCVTAERFFAPPPPPDPTFGPWMAPPTAQK